MASNSFGFGDLAQAGISLFTGGPVAAIGSLAGSALSGGFGQGSTLQAPTFNPMDFGADSVGRSAPFGSFAPNLDNPNFDANQAGPNRTILNDGTMVRPDGTTFAGPSAGQRYDFRTGQLSPLNQNQAQFMDVGRIVNPQEGGFSPSDPNRPVDTSAFQRGPVSINTPAGVFSGQNGDFTFAESDQIKQERAARTNSLFSLADTLESRAGVLTTKPLQKASRDVFDRTITAARQKREREVGNLSAQLSRRRIHGPLAAGQRAQLEEFFGDQEAELTSQQAVIEAELALKELGIETDLLTQASQARIQARALEIQDTVGDTELAGQLASQYAQMEEINLRTRLLVAAQEAESIRSNITAQETAQLDASSRASIASEQRSQTRGIGIGNLIGGIFGSSKDSLAGSIIGGIFGRR